jgi:outer membrane protein assembly factor BamB
MSYGNRLLVVLTILLVSTVSLAGDWAQWRGPNRDGRSAETGLLKAWPEGGPKLLWRADGLGKGFSTVAIAGDRIYTAGDKDGAAYVHALELDGGEMVWSVKIGKAGAPGWGGFTGPRSTPTVDGDVLYVMGQYGELLCLRTEDGAKVWEKHMTGDFGGKRPEWGFSESVLIDGDQLVCTPGDRKGAIVALDKRTGAQLWQTKDFTDRAHYSSLVCAEIEGVKQYVQLTPASVVGVSTDGAVLWQAKRKGKTAVIPTPIVSGNKVYVTSGYGIGCNLFEITRSGGKFQARQVYAEKSMADQHGGAVRIGDYVYGYCDAKGWVCQELATGALKWTEKKQVGKGSLVYADGYLVLRSESKGTVGLIKATPDGYEETGRFVQPDFGKPKTWPHPVIAGKKLYLRDQDILLCYDVAAR